MKDFGYTINPDKQIDFDANSKEVMNKVLRILIRTDDEGQRLRSIAPCCGILTQREVKAVWARYDPKPIRKTAAQGR